MGFSSTDARINTPDSSSDFPLTVPAEPVGIVHVVVLAKASKNGLAKLPDKTVTTVLPTTGVREYVPGNLSGWVDQSDRIIQFPLRQQPYLQVLGHGYVGP